MAPPQPPPERILVVKLGDIGDVLNITPALRALRERFPGVRIDLLTTRNGATALARSPHLDDVLRFDKRLFDRVGGAASPRALWAGLRFALDLRRRRYDTLVLLHHLITGWGTLKYTILALWSGAATRAGLDNGRGWFLTHRALDRGFGAIDERRYWLAVTALLGAGSGNDRPQVVITDADRAAARALLAPARRSPDAPVVVIAPTVGPYALSRQWPAGRFAAVADRLAREHGALLVLVGTAAEAPITAQVARAMTVPALDLAGRTDLPTLGGVLLAADLVIGNDSMVGHLGAALGRPTLSLFGPSNDRAWAPWGARTVVLPCDVTSIPPLPPSTAVVVRSADPHAPCLYVGYGPGNPAGCPHCRCLSAIDPDRVATLASQLLARMTTHE